MLRDNASVEKKVLGVSNDPVVRKLTCPENGVAAKKLVAARADVPTAISKRLAGTNALRGSRGELSSSSGIVTSRSTPRRVWRKRHATSSRPPFPDVDDEASGAATSVSPI